MKATPPAYRPRGRADQGPQPLCRGGTHWPKPPHPLRTNESPGRPLWHLGSGGAECATVWPSPGGDGG
eukprot:13745280-Alexandrium_andersonii.AAC.1